MPAAWYRHAIHRYALEDGCVLDVTRSCARREPGGSAPGPRCETHHPSRAACSQAPLPSGDGQDRPRVTGVRARAALVPMRWRREDRPRSRGQERPVAGTSAPASDAFTTRYQRSAAVCDRTGPATGSVRAHGRGGPGPIEAIEGELDAAVERAAGQATGRELADPCAMGLRRGDDRGREDRPDRPASGNRTPVVVAQARYASRRLPCHRSASLPPQRMLVGCSA